MLIELLVLGGTVLILASSSRVWIKILTINVRLPSTPSISGPGSATGFIMNLVYNWLVNYTHSDSKIITPLKGKQ